MKRFLLTLGCLAMMSTAGCATTGGLDSPLANTAATVADATLPPPPAPLAATVIDDKALDTAWRSFDIALDAVNLAMDICQNSSLAAGTSICQKLKPGSPTALRLADLIENKVLPAFKAAEAAAAAGSATSYRQALAAVNAGIADIKLIIGRTQ